MDEQTAYMQRAKKSLKKLFNADERLLGNKGKIITKLKIIKGQDIQLWSKQLMESHKKLRKYTILKST